MGYETSRSLISVNHVIDKTVPEQTNSTNTNIECNTVACNGIRHILIKYLPYLHLIIQFTLINILI